MKVELVSYSEHIAEHNFGSRGKVLHEFEISSDLALTLALGVLKNQLGMRWPDVQSKEHQSCVITEVRINGLAITKLQEHPYAEWLK